MSGDVQIRVLTGAALDAALDDVARLRMAVFRDWPYLYEGTLDYERRYLRNYQTSANSVLVGAFDGEALVGASTGAPMEDHAGEFSAAFAGTGLALQDIFYCAESVLLPGYRGRGIGWSLLDHVAELAKSWGVKRLQAIENRENHAAIQLEREKGFVASGIDGDPGLVLLERRF